MTTTKKRTSEAAPARPALNIQVSGIRIPIWKNEGDGGKIYYKAGQPELSYKDAEGRWQSGKSYGAHDLVNLIKAASLAHTEILRRNRAEQPEATTAETE